MNAITTQDDRVSTQSLTLNNGQNGATFAAQSLAEVLRFAEVMARAGLAVPKHLRDNPGACSRIVMQALEWGMSPFAVGDKSYSVNDRIAYEAQLIAAVVNTRSGIKGRLKYAYTGEGASLQCAVTGILDGEEFSYTSPRFDQITTKNSPLWKSDPQQQLGYFAARSWARRYVPEVLLGVYDREEVTEFGPDNARDVTPAPNLAVRLAAPAQQAREGFTGAVQMQPQPAINSAANASQAVADEPASTALNAGSGVINSPVVGDANISQTEAVAAVAEPENKEGVPDAKVRLVALAKQMLAVLAIQSDDQTMPLMIRLCEACEAEIGEAHRDTIKGLGRLAKQVVDGAMELGDVTAFMASKIGVTVEELAE